MNQGDMKTTASNIKSQVNSGKPSIESNRLPNFFIVGVAKSGTSSLFHYLGQHPQIYLSSVRAPNFFGLGDQPIPTYCGPVKHHHVKASTLADYQALFQNAQDAIALGEGSSFFNFTSRAAERIHGYVPWAKLIIILRQPADRAYSQYLYARRVGWEPSHTFQNALDEEERRKSESWFPFLCYQQSSMYAATLRIFYALFPTKQIHVILFDDFRQYPVNVMSELYRFLGVDPDFIPDVSVNHNPASIGLFPWLCSPHNERSARHLRFVPKQLRRALFRQMSCINVRPSSLYPRIRAKLTQRCRMDILATQKIIVRDLSDWLAIK